LSTPGGPGPQSSLAAALSLQRAVGNRAFGRLMRQCCGDPVAAARGAPWQPLDWRQRVGAPFLPGAGDRDEIDAGDVQQTTLGDCYFLASLAAVAAVNPGAIRRLIHSRPDASYDVMLYSAPLMHSDVRSYQASWRQLTTRPSEWHTVVTPAFPENVAQPGDRSPTRGEELWVMLLERAFARLRGGYERIAGGAAGDSLTAITGRIADSWETAMLPIAGGVMGTPTAEAVRANAAFQRLADAFAHRHPTVCGTQDCFAGSACARAHRLHAHAQHAYALLGIDARARTVDLHNPWGREHLYGLGMQDFWRSSHSSTQ
jgi:hypothetical protein